MNRKVARFFHWLSLPVLAGALAYFLVRDPAVRELWQDLFGGPPVLDVPVSIKLGEHPWGKEVRARFSIVNRGRKDLVLDQFSTTCSCASLEPEDRSTPLQFLQIGPGEEAWLRMRIGVRGQIGAAFRVGAFFRTNDPTSPEAGVEFLISNITGGISAMPTSLDFGSVAIDAKACRSLEIRDTSARPRAIKSVASSNPDQFNARLIEQVRAPAPPTKDRPSTLLGRVEVVLKTSEARVIAGHVVIDLDDSSASQDKVRVTARVTPVVEAFPSSVVLPRFSSKGPIDFMNCLCRSTTGQPLVLRAKDIPQGVSVQISSVPNDSSQQMARISFKRDPANSAVEDFHQSVHFRASVGDQETTLIIPLRIIKDHVNKPN